MDRDRERSLNARIARTARATEDPYTMTSAARAARLKHLRAQATAENPPCSRTRSSGRCSCSSARTWRECRSCGGQGGR